MGRKEDEAELKRLEMEDELARLEAEDAAAAIPSEMPQPEQLTVNTADPESGLQEAGLRLAYKNVLSGTDPKATLEWLKSKAPDREWKFVNNEPYYKRHGQKTFYPMDPAGFDIQDITDVAGDVATGALSAGAGALGFMAGGPLGAAAAGGASSVGLETLKQLVAKGMHGGDVNKTAIATQGVLGTVAPKLFGVGLSAKQIAGQAAAKNIPVETVKKEIAGVVPELVKKGFAGAGNLISGVSSSAIRGYAKYRPQVDAMIARGHIVPEATDLQNKVVTLVDTARQQAGQELQQEIGQAHSLFNTQSLFQPVLDKKAELQALIQKVGSTKYWQGGRTAPKSLDDQLTAVQKVLDDELGGLADNIAPEELFKLQKMWKNRASFDVDMRKLRAENPEAANIAEVYRDLYKGINQRLEAATQGKSSELKAKVKQLIELSDDIDTHFATPETTQNFLLGMESNAARGDTRRNIAEQLKRLSNGQLDLANEYPKFEAYRMFRNPNLAPISSGGTTSTTRTLLTSGLGGVSGGAISPWLSVPVGAATTVASSPWAMKQYAKGARYAGQAMDVAPNIVQKIPPYLMSNEILQMMYGQQPEQEQIP